MPEPLDPVSPLAASWADIFAEMPERRHPLLGNLTAAEKVVAQHVSRGLTNREIALVLAKSESTVKRQVSACLRKFGVRTRTRLIALFR